MNMKYAACFLLSGFAAIAIMAVVIWAMMNYPHEAATVAIWIGGVGAVGCIWGLFYLACSQAIKNREVPSEDMIRGIHYDIDPRSESLRTPPSPPTPPPTRRR